VLDVKGNASRLLPMENRGKSNREHKNKFLLLKIQEIHIKNRRNYGSTLTNLNIDNNCVLDTTPICMSGYYWSS